MCAACHIGYGYRDKDFDFDDEETIDCLVCHDTTGLYKKGAGLGGFPTPETNEKLKEIAQNVGKPQRHNCLACHANGGGGNGVKWGDTDTSLINPDHDLDVHMDADGLNMSCQDCHTAKDHRISGEYIDRAAFLDHEKDMRRRERKGHNVSCEACHGNKPHNNWRLDNHTDKVACATCHVPYGARGGIPTKLQWDWSKAGLNTDHKPIAKFGGKPLNEHGHPIDGRTGKPDTSIESHKYMAIKGEFVYGTYIVPEYAWYKGERKVRTFFDKFDPSKYSKKNPLPLKWVTGSYDDPKAKIYPFKVHRATMPYDTEYKTLLPPHLWSLKKGEGAFWRDFNWDTALKVGSEYSNVPFSGKYDFIWTSQYMQIKHMVAPKAKALSCNECHKNNGRLENVPGFYMVGRDGNKYLDWLGLLMIFGSLMGVAGHGFLRFINKNNKQD
jgi:octaheme c-type cytochrome (tetrathionate reductase family)